MTTDNIKDLVKRLRDCAATLNRPGGILNAADALEAMAGENKALTEELALEIKKTHRYVEKTFELETAVKKAEAERDRLKAALDHVGDAICDVFEQMAKGSWQDDMGHPVMNNAEMLKLKDALKQAAGGEG